MLVEMEVGVLALDDLDTAVIAVVDLHAVSSAIGPSGLLILSYHVDTVPINRPPSSGLKKGTGNASISTSFPSMTISKTGPESTTLALTGFFVVTLHPFAGHVANRRIKRHAKGDGESSGSRKCTCQNRNVIAFDVLEQKRGALSLLTDFGYVA